MSRSHHKVILLVIALGIFVAGVALTLYTKRDTAPITPEVVTTPLPEEAPVKNVGTERLIGSSVEGRPLTAYTYGNGPTHLLFVGGMHGGYEWNSSLLAYNMMDYFTENPTSIPEDITVTIIPVLNPDGLFAVVGIEGRFAALDVPNSTNTSGTGRFNANDVDLNRNFDCKWQPSSSWRNTPVSAGTAAFSEPEAAALRDLVLEITPSAVTFWHSTANNVYASECEAGVLPETLDIMHAYATAADYGAIPVFDAYPITGDAEGWLASIGIPAITVELETRNSIEWARNLAGIEALFTYYTATEQEGEIF